jgi:UDP-GlcNAc:undecaprenyl-phosphate GlcNAc-1-phosphate transferase
MGDTGSTFLGYVLSTISIQGLFKYYAVISFAVPFLILGLPMFDTLFAIIRRLAHGKNPMSPDRGHIHHRLIDMGLSQKQAVAALYVVSSILGLSAVVLATSGAMRAMLFFAALVVVAFLASRVIFPREIEQTRREREGGKPDFDVPLDDHLPDAPEGSSGPELHPAVDADRSDEETEQENAATEEES